MMRPILFLIILQFFTQNILAQNELKNVREVISDYIEGSVGGDTVRIKNAFHKDAAQFAVGVKNEIIKIPVDNYIGFLELGKTISRNGEINYIDIVHDTAMAKVEFDMSSRKYTVYLLLLKGNQEWKIVQKSYTSISYKRKGKILIVASSASEYGDSNASTGAHFGEIVIPYHEFIKSGYAVDIASPKGGQVPVAYIELHRDLQKKYFYDTKFNQKLKYSSPIDQIKPDDYEAIFFAGGGAAMFDFPQNVKLQEVIRHIYEENNGIVSGVCHGPAALVNVKLSDGKFLVQDKNLTAFSNEEESYNSKKNYLPFLLQSKLESRGAIFLSAKPGKPKIISDGRLITGQNPASSKELSKEIIRKLNTLK